jgi:hypothetical protein
VYTRYFSLLITPQIVKKVNKVYMIDIYVTVLVHSGMSKRNLESYEGS